MWQSTQKCQLTLSRNLTYMATRDNQKRFHP